MRTLTQVDITGLRVLLRVDYNVPLDERGEIIDDFKIKQSLPTLKYVLKRAKQVIIMSHLGRPEGKHVKELKMDKVALRLMKHVGKNVTKLDDCVNVVIPDEKVVLLENLRFHKEEKENNSEFAKKLASHGDVFVNDAFGVSHRAHASTVGVTKFLPSCAGLLIQKEVENLDFSKAERPLIVIVGGSKLSTKFPVMNSLLPEVDELLVGGAMIFTFYKSLGLEIGGSMCEDNQIVTAKLLLNNEKLILPSDVVVASEVSEKAKSKTVETDKIPKKWIGLDLGEKTIEDFKKRLKKAKTVFWNGPLGVYEIEKYAKASYDLTKFLAGLKAKVIIGGGDSAAIVEKLGLRDEFSHVSTGGGASLEFIQKGTLPALEVLKN
ncbi:phosphoglycerate kinase [Candidatus Woesearchaeota archaeon]|nr:phosphoglycerate kinase [Candidatus Woesearchaeota archaeon]